MPGAARADLPYDGGDVGLCQLYGTDSGETVVTIESTTSKSEAIIAPPTADLKATGELQPPALYMINTRSQRFKTKARSSLSAYKVVFTFLMVLNLAILIPLHNSLALSEILLGVSSNLFISILIRQEHLVNLAYGVFDLVPHTSPFSVRKKLANLYHYGGIHSGCATSSLMWCIAYVVCLTEKTFEQKQQIIEHYTSLGLAYLFLLLMALVAWVAFPPCRRRYHNLFEHTHRFGGWAALLIIWTLKILDDVIAHEFRLWDPSLWLLGFTTLIIFFPWVFCLWQQPVTKAELLSPKVLRLTLPYGNMPPCRTMRFSTSPFKEWHAFATIPVSRTHFSVIINGVGDWTKALCERPPRHIWIRNPPTRNFLFGSKLFGSVLLVATGSGIGPCLSLLGAPSSTKIHVLWSVRDAEGVYGQEAVSMVLRADPHAGIGNFRQGFLEEVEQRARLYGVEAVFVVSNRELTKEIVGGMKRMGYATYGAIFDS